MKVLIRLSTIFAIPIIALQFILFSFNTANGDMALYLIRYSNVGRLGPGYFGNLVDIGFNYFMSFAHIFNLNYQGFLILCGILIFSILIFVCKRYNADYFYFFFYFLFSFFFIEAVILRQFIASAVVSLAFVFLTEDNRWQKNLVCLGLLVLASSFHISALLSFLYFFSYKFSLRKLYYGSFIGLVFSYPLITIALPIVTRLLGAKFALYTKEVDASFISFLAKAVFALVSILLFQLLHDYFVKNSQFYQAKHQKLTSLALKATLINTLSMPLMLVNISFERLLLVPVFIYLTTIAVFFRMKAPFTRQRIFIILLIVAWIFLAYRIFVWSDMKYTTFPILTENLLWGN